MKRRSAKTMPVAMTGALKIVAQFAVKVHSLTRNKLHTHASECVSNIHQNCSDSTENNTISITVSN